MRKALKYLLSCFLVLGSCSSFSQNSNIDSLKILIKADKADTNKLIHLNKLSREFINEGNYDSALLYANSVLQHGKVLFKEVQDPKSRYAIQKYNAAAYNNIGIVYDDQGNFSEALRNYFASLEIREAIGDRAGLAGSYNNIGIIYEQQGNYPEALKHLFASLKIEEELGNKDGIGASYSNIGNVNTDQGNYKEALKNHLASLKIKKELNDKRGSGIVYNNIGLAYYNLANYPEALKNHFAALKIREELGEKRGIASSYNNIGLVYFDQALEAKDPALRNEKFEQALNSYFAALKLEEATGWNSGTALSYNNIANVYIKQKKYKDAEEYLLKAEKILKKIGYKEYLRGTYRQLTELDSARGNFKGAYENHKMFILYRDSLDNEETRKKTIQSQMTYDFEKKEAIAAAEHKKELENQEALAEEKSQKQKTILLFVIAGLLLVIVFAGFIFRSLRITRRQKSIIEEQKVLVEKQKQVVEYQKSIVEEHQKEIIDSIMYARRIQLSLLPTEKYIERNINRLRKV